MYKILTAFFLTFATAIAAAKIPIHNMTDEWTDPDETYYAIKMSVTDTDSADDSKLMGLILDGTDMFSIGKFGDIYSSVGRIFFYDAANSNISIGYRALDGTTSDFNVGIGYRAGDGLGSVDGKSTAIGYEAMSTTSGKESVAVGWRALSSGDHKSDYVTAVGAYAGYNVTNQQNTAIGAYAMYNAGGYTNTVMGYFAAHASSGNYNLILGAQAAFIGSGVISGDHNILIGTWSQLLDVTHSDQLVIGNMLYSTPAIMGYMGARSDVDYSGRNLTVSGPSAFASATTNQDGGNLVLQGGQAASGGGSDGAVLINGADTVLTLGDNAGVNKFSILDSDDTEVANVDSYGKITVASYAGSPTTSSQGGYWFGDGDTGFYENNGNLLVNFDGAFKWLWQDTQLAGYNITAGAIMNSFASGTVPTLLPRKAAFGTGIGAAGNDELSLIAGSVEGIRVSEAAAAITIESWGTNYIYGSYTDVSNYERLSISGDGTIEHEAAGTGTVSAVNMHNAAFTVATLPTPTVGMTARITDGDVALAWGATAVNSGAGATPYLVWYNGTNWTILGN